MHEPSKYVFGDADDREYETDFPGFGRTFPHPYGDVDDKYFTTRLTLSPAGDELTLDFAKSLLDNEQLGQDEVPGYLNDLGIDKAHYFDTKALVEAPAIAALKKQFGIGEELIEAYFHPYICLDHGLIRDKGLDQAVVEQAIAAELMKFGGVAYAVSSTALRTGSLPDTLLMRSILRNFHPKRSGDVYLVFEPNDSIGSSSDDVRIPFFRSFISTRFTASRCIHVENAASPRKVLILRNTCRNASWVRSSASAGFPVIRRHKE